MMSVCFYKMFLNDFESLLEFLINHLTINTRVLINQDKNNLDLALKKTKNLLDECNKNIFNSKILQGNVEKLKIDLRIF